MFYWIKAIVSGLIIAGSSSLAQKYPGPAGVLIALPTTTLLTMAWMGQQGATKSELATFLMTVGWITLAGIGFFFLTPVLIKNGWSFWVSFFCGIVVLILGSWIAVRMGAY